MEEETKKEEVIVDEVDHVVTAEDVANNPESDLLEGETVAIPVIAEEVVVEETL